MPSCSSSKRHTIPSPLLEGKPTDNDLLSIRATILPLLMVIPYNLLGGIHSLTAILMDPAKYEEAHGNAKFVYQIRLPLYDSKIKNNAMTIICIRAEASHKSRLDNYTSYKAAEQGVAKFLCKAIKDVWYKDLKDAETFYTKVTALDIMALLDANSGGLHAINMIGLRTSMHQYYTQDKGIPQFTSMMDDAQKKAKRAGMPIANVKLVMIASAAMLAAQHFPRKADNLEGLPPSSRTWTAWKTAFRLAHVKHQRQILASGGSQPLGGALAVIPAPSTIDQLESALNNLMLTATNDTAILQQLTAANLALTTAVTTLTVTNKKLVDAAAKGGGPPPMGTTPCTPAAGGRRTKNLPWELLLDTQALA
jgi:hypothetical protein